jgi:hypothetical protein
MVDFKINDDGSETTAVAGEVVAEVQTSTPTPLASLQARREQIVNDLYTDIQVPRWDSPEIYVRFKPVSTIKLNAAIERRRKQKGDDWSLLANADMLIESCVGIYAVFNGDTENKLSLSPTDPNGKWTKFDTELAKALGVDAQRATDSVQALYLTEGDLIDTANRLFRWSNVANDEADETF